MTAAYHPNADPVKEILKCLENCTAGGQGHYNIFNDWLDITLASLEALPTVARQSHEGQPLTDTPETEKLFQQMHDRYPGDYYWQNFTHAFAALLESTSEFQDTIGTVYMNFNVSNKYTGQFFTPWNIAKFMAQMTLHDIEPLIHERMKAAINGDPVAEALLMSSMILTDGEDAEDWFYNRILPAAAPHFDPITVMDCCCGSGVMLLAAASEFPRWALDWGLVRFYGMDIDNTCVKMAKINCMLYGLNGFSMKCALSLTDAELAAIPEPQAAVYREAKTATPERVEEIKQEIAEMTRNARQLSIFDTVDAEP